MTQLRDFSSGHFFFSLITRTKFPTGCHSEVSQPVCVIHFNLFTFILFIFEDNVLHDASTCSESFASDLLTLSEHDTVPLHPKPELLFRLLVHLNADLRSLPLVYESCLLLHSCD